MPGPASVIALLMGLSVKSWPATVAILINLPLAIVVLGGLITSTLLTLVVLPALYARFGRWLLPKASAWP